MMKRQVKVSLIVLLTVVLALPALAQGKPKNVIVMIADGWGFEQLSAAQYYDNGGEAKFFDFMTPLAMSTWSASSDGYDPAKAWGNFKYLENKPTDSAASATALSTGVRTKNGMIGEDPDGKRLRHLYEEAEDEGKSTGLVTTVPLSHATPAGFSAHADSRADYPVIAQEMLTGTPIDVIMGCGNPEYDDNGEKIPEDKLNEKSYQYVGGKALWEELKKGEVAPDADGDGKPDPWTLIESREQFQALGNGDTPKRVVGVAEVQETLQIKRKLTDEKSFTAAPFEIPMVQNVPTLKEMVCGALNVLDNDKDGLFMMIEGGAIDWAGHANVSSRSIEEQLDFRDAVMAVKAWVEKNSSWDETLLVITADHETGYLTGPGPDGEWQPVENKGKGNLPGMKWNLKSHSNSLVPLFVKGPGADAIVAKATNEDTKRGKFLHSTELSQTLHELLK